ncbi:hypothetical protein DH2020_000702 [Rehmannia glutinosa]|uniref:Integrase zinc-binding domain-containing protein n=1 Tax=Rehmannia glutinosa TaxID=99300 RepID=A0ABR0XXP4_REHGL
MYKDLKRSYWWVNMKNQVAEFVARCLTCQRVKAEHQRPSGLLQPLRIPKWKWEHITMDFVTDLPRTRGGHDAIWVVETDSRKSHTFYPSRKSDSLRKLASIPFLRLISMDFQGSWDLHLPLAEFAYNNSYQATIGMAPYEALYGRKCRSPLHWEIAQSRQKSYADKRRKDLEFEVVDEVFLKLSRMHDVFHVSRLKKYQPDPEHIITQDTPPLIENLSYTERPIRIIDQQIRQLHKREIPMVKVVWQNQNRDEDATWEMEEDMRNQYPELF